VNLKGKTLFIAGASGMAAATARLAVAQGAQVFSVDRNPDATSSLSQTLEGEIETYCADLADEDSVERAFARCCERYGIPDSVFHAVGLSGRRLGDGKLHECSLQAWEATLTANTTTCFLVCRAALRLFMERNQVQVSNARGTILTMASVLAFSPEPTHFASHAYAASKGAVIAMTRAAAAAYAPHGININALAPSLVATPMSKRAQEDAEIVSFIRHKQPLSSGILESDDVARIALFLLSDDARNITGQVVPVDGGWTVSS
jgi:NAD(P)-dependent dehydrogenase (short-subunit alcohol dehydrogenase family)